MALRDSSHRTLVYFGLAEEADEYDDYEPEAVREQPEAALADRYRERPNVRRLQGRRVATSSTTSSPTMTAPPRRRRGPPRCCAP